MKKKHFFYSSLVTILFSLFVTACSSTSSTKNAHSGNAVTRFIRSTYMEIKQAIAIAFDANTGQSVNIAQLQAEQTVLKSVGGTVYQVGDFITIVIPLHVVFEPGKAVLLLDADQYIAAAADIIRQYPTHNVLVTANEAGLFSKKDDMALSIKQAEVAAAGLFSHGINSNFGDRNVYYTGLGDLKTAADDRYAAGMTANRRIQITLYPSKKTYLNEGTEFNIGAY